MGQESGVAAGQSCAEEVPLGLHRRDIRSEQRQPRQPQAAPRPLRGEESPAASGRGRRRRRKAVAQLTGLRSGVRHGGTEYIFYCKRAILFLSSSKILTPHPPFRPASLSSPRNKGGGRGVEGMGGQYFGRREE
jgi:hypothetical protein